MKKQLSKVIAMTLVCAMTLPSAVFASTAPSISGNTPGSAVSSNSANISGNGVVDQSTYNLMLPSDLDFAIDRFEVNEAGQIYGVDYPIVNASNFPVKVDLAVTVSSNVADFVSANDLKLSSTSANHAIYMAAYVPDRIAVDSVSAGAVSSNTVSGNYTSVSDNVVFALDSAEPTTFSFKLDKLADISSSNLSVSNCATFTWTGAVNSQTEWADGDVSVDGAFTFYGLAKNAYEAVESDTGNNLVTGAAGAEVTDVTYTRSAGGNAEFTVSVDSGVTLSSAKIKLQAGAAPFDIPTPGVYTYSDGTFKLLGSSNQMKTAWAVGTHTITLTFSDSTTKTLTLKIVR